MLSAKSMFKNKIVKDILTGVSVPIFGFILLNLTFIFDFLFQSSILAVIKLFTPVDFQKNFHWFPPIMHGSFVIIIGIISRFVFKSKLKTFYKAIYLTVPLAVVFVSLGMSFYQTPLVSFLLSSIITFSLFYFFYRTKKPWLYYYVLILVSLTMAISSLMGLEI